MSFANLAVKRTTCAQTRMLLIVCAILVILPVNLLLTGCAHESSVPAQSSVASSMLYQPPVLRLPANQMVQTKDGKYVPQRDEIWHSDARFRQLEQENVDLAAALLKAQRN